MRSVIDPRSLLAAPFGFLLFAVVLAGCAGSAETASSSDESSASASEPAAVGVWDYEARSQQGTYRGTLTITQTENGEFRGDIETEDSSVGPLDVENVTYSDSTLTFDITGGQAGPMEASVDIGEGQFDGEIDVAGYGMSMPFSATKQNE